VWIDLQKRLPLHKRIRKVYGALGQTRTSDKAAPVSDKLRKEQISPRWTTG